MRSFRSFEALRETGQNIAARLPDCPAQGVPFTAALEVIRCVQSLDDTELYQLTSEDGRHAAPKLGRANAHDRARRMFDREAAMLERLAGVASPRLLRNGTTESGQRYLLMEWYEGRDCASVSAMWRAEVGAGSRRKLLVLCSAILDAYAHLHEGNVINSDIHPRCAR